ncbi:MAG: hypothetical protein QNJ70_10865 [Xenococcaceae cyanobacterium MO_207.B15]|nr:hypothetical protein [Xenococcaceae cyanobacterium MO_207.B15]
MEKSTIEKPAKTSTILTHNNLEVLSARIAIAYKLLSLHPT